MNDGADRPANTSTESANTEAPAATSWSGKRSNSAGFGGSIWFIGWLFTIGYAELAFWKAALALFIWPYYLGETLRLAFS